MSRIMVPARSRPRCERSFKQEVSTTAEANAERRYLDIVAFVVATGLSKQPVLDDLVDIKLI